MCRPGRYILATVPAFQWMWGRQDVINQHKRRYRSRQLAELSRDQGLEISRLTYLNRIAYPLVAAVRLARCIAATRNGELQPDFAMTLPGPLSVILSKVFTGEGWVLRRWRLPIAVSLLCVARRPLDA